MKSTLRRNLWFVLFFAFVVVKLRGDQEAKNGVVNDAIFSTNGEQNAEKTHNEVLVNDKRRNNNAGGGGGAGWGWGGGGGGANRHGGWGWGNGGGGGVYWRWGCGTGKRGHCLHKKRGFPNGEFKLGVFAQCMIEGRCKGMRLDCPLHCGGPCFYDCRHMCKAHCKR